MYLTPEEERMFAGKDGEGNALAMRVLVGIGEAFGAERMVEIKRAHVAISNQGAHLWFAQKLVIAGAKCKVAPTVNPNFNLKYFQSRGMAEGEALVSTDDICFYLVDTETGVIIEDNHNGNGTSVSRKVLIFP